MTGGIGERERRQRFLDICLGLAIGDKRQQRHPASRKPVGALDRRRQFDDASRFLR